jgi:S1-C subfamily serine protease
MSHISHRLVPVACGFALLAAFLSLRAAADQPPASPAASPPPALTLYDRAMPGAVEVLVNDHLNGSGWIADREGHVFTAAHVVAGDNRRIEVLTREHGRLDAKIIALDLGHDLALLRLPPRDEGYAFIPNAARMPPAGSDVYLFGSPIYRHSLLLKGAVARNGTTFEYLPDQRAYIETVHVAADTPRGTSGGPWLNEAGQIIGLQSGMMRDQNAQVGIAFVIPVEPIIALLKSKVSASTPTLGAAVEEIWEQPWDFLKKFPAKTEGVVIRNPDSDGMATKAGLLELDLVVAVNDEPVRLRDQFVRIIRTAKPGDELTFKTMRAPSTTPRIVKVKLEKMEKN